MYGWIIFILGIVTLVMGALAQNTWVVPAIAISWWVTQYRSMKKVKEKRIILNRLHGLDHGKAPRQLFA
jgi:hypothetical protein